tara:strand:+ start:21345 stop:22133 length:789 start_codon:yes stop_codon:yes gene_type:complete
MCRKRPYNTKITDGHSQELRKYLAMKPQSQETYYDIRWGRHILLTIAAILLIPYLVRISGLDYSVAHAFYDGQSWLIEARQPILRFLFYILPKWLLVTFASCMLILLALSFCVKGLRRFRSRRQLFIVLCAALVPLIVGAGKKLTNIYCPYQLEEFGGSFKEGPIFDFISAKSAACFPAGHASGGFALLFLVPLAKPGKQRNTALIFALIAGWVMGGFQMLNGRHFLSHTIVTMLLAWIIVVAAHYLIIGQSQENRGLKRKK